MSSAKRTKKQNGGCQTKRAKKSEKKMNCRRGGFILTRRVISFPKEKKMRRVNENYPFMVFRLSSGKISDGVNFQQNSCRDVRFI